MAEFQYAPVSASLFCLQTQVKIYWDLMATYLMSYLCLLLQIKFSRRISGEITVSISPKAIKTANRRVNIVLSNLY